MNVSESTAPLDVESLRSEFPVLHQTVYRQKPLVYFDNASTTQHPRMVLEAMNQMYERNYANVHRAAHYLSEQATMAYDGARESVRAFINARHAREVVFTQGTTSAVNLVARAWGDQNIQPGDEILLTIAEHHSNLVPWQQLAARRGAKVVYCELAFDPAEDVRRFTRLLTSRTRVAAFTATSNVLGYRLPVRELVAAAHAAGAKVLVDAAQHVPHESVDVQLWDVDWMAFSGHKMLGPSGIGVLYGREQILEAMPPFLGGGSMIESVDRQGFVAGELPAKFEAGTPPIVEAVGLAAAIEYLRGLDLARIAEYGRQLILHLHARLAEIKPLRIFGSSCQYKSAIASFCVADVSNYDLAEMLDLQGFAVRLGHHCAMPLHEFLGVPNTVRASLYLYNTFDEIDRFADALAGAIPKLAQ